MTPIAPIASSLIDPVSLGGAVDAVTYVISPSPVLWSQELEGANPRPNQPSVWHELMLRARQRGSKSIGKLDWPGQVLLPSALIKRLVHQKKLQIPSAWKAMEEADWSRFVALVNAWHVDRLIYDFTGLAADIVSNSQVAIPLTPNAFSLMPGHAIYIDFESMDFRTRHLPGGAFVGLNVNDDNALELVIAVDQFNGVKIFTFALNGETVDQVIARLLISTKKNIADPLRQDVFTFVDHHLHTLLSAVLMVCSSQSSLSHVSDSVSREDGLGLWTRWRISKAFTTQLNQAHEKAVAQSETQGESMSPVVIAEWVDPGPDATARLRCVIVAYGDATSSLGVKGGQPKPVRRQILAKSGFGPTPNL